jgi:hypothetical protein
LLLVDRWRRTGDTRSLFLAAYVGGLAVGHQPLTVWLLPAVIILLVLRLRDGRLPPVAAAGAVGFFVLPFTLFAVLPIRSAAHPAIDYAQIQSARDFFYHALGVASRSEFMSEGMEGVRLALREMGHAFGVGAGPATALLTLAAIAGAVRLARRDGEGLLLFGLPLVAILVFAHVYAIHDVENYMILPFWLAAVLAGAIFAVPRRDGEGARTAADRLGARWWGYLVGVVLILGASHANRAMCDRSGYHLVDDFVSNTFMCLPPQSALFLYTETQVGPFAYHTVVERKRPDLAIVDMTGKVLVQDHGFREITGDWREERWRRMEVLFEDRPPELAGRTFTTFMFVPRDLGERPSEYVRRGLVYQLQGPGSEPPPPATAFWSRFRFRLPRPEVLRGERTGFSLTPLILRFYADAGTAAAETYMAAGDVDAAIRTYREVGDFAPRSLTVPYALAQLHAQRGETEAEIAALERVIAIDPEAVAALNALGVLAMSAGRLVDAEGYFVRAVAADPEDPLARLNYGSLLAQDPARRDEALAHFEAYLRLAPEDPDAERVRDFVRVLRQME